MPKAKLRVVKSDGQKFKTACGIYDVKIGGTKPVGNEVVTEITYSSIQQIYDLRGAMPGLKGDELDEPEEKGSKK